MTDVELDAEAIEVVARWLVQAPDEREGRTTVFFLELPGGAEPSNELLERVSTSTIRVERLSAHRLGGSYMAPVDAESGVEGTILTIGKSARSSDGRLHVEVARHCGGLCGQGGTLILQKSGDAWVVLDYGMRWIS